MTDKEIFTRVINKAYKQKNNIDGIAINFKFKDEADVYIQDLLNTKNYYRIIFSHNFAKAFFGEKDFWQETECTCGGAIHPILDKHYEHCKRAKAKRDYKFHLQQMVIEEEPLKYLAKFLKGSVD